MIDDQSKPRIALAHDWLVGMRGGEFVLDRLARQYGPTELYTLVSNGRPLTEALRRRCNGFPGRRVGFGVSICR